MLQKSPMIDAQARCFICSAFLPVVRSSAVTWTTGMVVTGLGATVAKTWWGRVLTVGAGLATTALVERLARPVCGQCGAST
jgi:hypothetical protein